MLKDIVKASRSRRSFRPNVEISRDVLLEIIDTARFSPAARNLQVLKYRLVTDKKEVSELTSLTYWAGSLGIKLPPDDHEPSAFIVICHDTMLDKPSDLYSMDVGISAQTIMLAATEMRLGGCMLGSFSAKKIKETLNIAEHLEPKLIIALGLPDDKIELVDVIDDKVKYYRDENNVHYVPKRSIDEIII